MERFINDIKYGLRRILLQPWSSFVIIITLALGIGANSAIFSVVNGVLLQQLPFDRSEDLVILNQNALASDNPNMRFSVKEIVDYRTQTKTLEDIVEFHSMNFTLLGREEPIRTTTGVVSANYFDFLGVKPILGRSFLPEEDIPGSAPVVILSYEFWQSKFGADENIVGQYLEMNNKAHLVVGVLPSFPQYPSINDLYMPTSACPTRSSEAMISNRNGRMMQVFGRVKSDQSFMAANTEIDKIGATMAQAHPENYPKKFGFKASIGSLREAQVKDIRTSLYILMGTALLVLLIACANVTNLTLAQQAKRQKELAIRAATGADKYRIARQLLTESVVLAAIGGVLGLYLANLSLDLLISFVSRFTSRASEIEIDKTVLFFTFAVSLLTGIVAGLIPALSKQNLSQALKEGGDQSTGSGGKMKARNVLVIAQLAISFMLLIGAGLMIRSVMNLQAVDPGFNSKQVLTMSMNLNWSKYSDAVSQTEFISSLKTSIDKMPGVESSTLAQSFPYDNNGVLNLRVVFGDRPQLSTELPIQVDFQIVNEDYFETLQIPLSKGRVFSSRDDSNSPLVVLVSNAMAKAHWPDKSPLDETISINGGKTWRTVVGIVGDVKRRGLDGLASQQIYIPIAQLPTTQVSVLVRTTGAPEKMTRQLRRQVYELDDQQPINSVVTLSALVAESIASPKLITLLLTIFGSLALLITMAGISGVIAYSVSQRTREIGIRMALGAQRDEVLTMILKQGLRLTGIGLILGLLGAIVLSNSMADLLFGISTWDIVTYVLVGLVLMVVAVFACWLPAKRASAVSPSVAFRAN
jgi:putative ABC transport system permease protein